MQKTIKNGKKALSLFLAVLMVLTSWVFVAPKAEAAHNYLVKVYVRVYDGAKDIPGSYEVVTDQASSDFGKPSGYSWANSENDGYNGDLNMAGISVIWTSPTAGKSYLTQDMETVLEQCESTTEYIDMYTLTPQNYLTEGTAGTNYHDYTFEFNLDALPEEVFWMVDDDNPWGGDKAGYGIYKVTLTDSATAGSTEKTLWSGLSAGRSQNQCYYGSITPSGLITPYDVYDGDRDEDYRAFTTSNPGSWKDYISESSHYAYPVNTYMSGGVSVAFSTAADGTVTDIKYVDAGDTEKTYYMNLINHSYQSATITSISNSAYINNYPGDGKIVIPSNGVYSLELDKNDFNGDGESAIDMTVNYTLENVYNSDGTTLTAFNQPAFIGYWNTADDSKEIGVPEGTTKEKPGMTMYYSGWYGMYQQFKVKEGILEPNSLSGNETSTVSFVYDYWLDLDNASNWLDAGLRMYVQKFDCYNDHRRTLNYNENNAGSIFIYSNDSNATFGITEIEAIGNELNPATSAKATATNNGTATPIYGSNMSLSGGTIYDVDDGGAYFHFLGNIPVPLDDQTSADRIGFDSMRWVYPSSTNTNWAGYSSYFSGTINIYAVDKGELAAYVADIGGYGADWAPMSERYNSGYWATYKNALSNAMAVLANQKVVQNEVTEALNGLKEAASVLYTDGSLVNQVANVTYSLHEGDSLSTVLESTDAKYMILSLGEQTLVGNDDYLARSNKNSNIVTNYTAADTSIDIINYKYWNIEYAYDVDGDGTKETIGDTIDALDTKIADTSTVDSYKEKLEAARATLAAIDQTDGTSTPVTQAEVDDAITAAYELVNHEHEFTYSFTDAQTTGWPTYDSTTGEFTSELIGTCDCGETVTLEYGRANYEEYDKCYAEATELLNSGTLTDEAAKTLKSLLTTDICPDNCWADVTDGEGNVIFEGEQKTVDKYTELLKGYIATFSNEKNLKVDYTAIDEEIAEYNTLTVGVSDADKATAQEIIDYVAVLKENNPNATQEDYQDTIDGYVETLAAINDKYAACQAGNHTWNDGVFKDDDTTTYPYGYYLKTCTVCDATTKVAADPADYDAVDKAIAKLQEVLKDDMLDADVKAEIEAAIKANDAVDTSDNTLDRNLSDYEQDKVDAAAEALEKLYAQYVNEDGTLRDDAIQKYTVTFYDLDNNVTKTITVKKGAYVDADQVPAVPKKSGYDGDVHYVTDWSEDVTENPITSNVEVKVVVTTEAHAFAETLTRPTQNEDGTWTNGTYTYEECTCGATKDSEPAYRANYSTYDEIVAALNAYAAKDLTDENKAKLNAVIAQAEAIQQDYVTAEQDKLDEQVAALKAAFDTLDADFKTQIAADTLVNKYTVTFTDGTTTETVTVKKGETAKATAANFTKASDDVNEYTAAGLTVENVTASQIATVTYTATAHEYGNPVLTTAPAADGSAKGVYTQTCACGYKKTTEVDLASEYTAYYAAKAALEELKKTDGLTDAAKDAIDAKIAAIDNALDKQIPADIEDFADADQQPIINATNALNDYIAEVEAGIANGTLLNTYTVTFQNEAGDVLDEVTVTHGGNATPDAAKIAKDSDDVYEYTAIDATTTNVTGNTTVVVKYTATPHVYGEAEVIVRPVYDEDTDTWSQGTLQATCTNEGCGYTKTWYEYRANYEKFEAAKKALVALMADNNLTQDVIDEINAALAEAAELKDDLVTSEQSKVDAATAALNVVLTKYDADKDGTVDDAYLKPDFTDYDTAKGKYDDLVGGGADVLDSIKEEVVELSAKIEAIREDDDATKADDQKTIDAATERLNEIIEGIENGSLVKPDYSGAEDALLEAEENDNIPEDAQKELEELEAQLQEIKDNNPNGDKHESNANDDQTKVNEIEEAIEKIVNKYANCAEGHTWSYVGLTENENGEVVDGVVGYHTLKCNECETTTTVDATLADYTPQTDTIAYINGLLTKYDDQLTAAAKETLNAVIDMLNGDEEAAEQFGTDPFKLNASKLLVVDGVTYDDSFDGDTYVENYCDRVIELVNEELGIDEDGNITNGDYLKGDESVVDEARELIEAIKEALENSEPIGKAELTEDKAQLLETAEGIVENLEKALENGTEFTKAMEEEVLAGIETLEKYIDNNGTTDDTTDDTITESYLKADTSALEDALAAYKAAAENSKPNEVLDSVATYVATVETLLAEIKADTDGTQADYNKQINEAIAQLNEYIDTADEPNDIKDEYLKPYYTDAQNAIDNANKIESLTEDEKAKLVELQNQLNDIINAEPESTKAEKQDEVDEIEAAAQDIVNAHADCTSGNHPWSAPELTTAPTETEKGTYTFTCTVDGCDETATLEVERADYSALNEAIAALEALKTDNALTAETIAKIDAAIATAKAIDQNLPKTITAAENTVTGEEIKGGEDKITAAITAINAVKAEVEADIAAGTAVKPDYTEANENLAEAKDLITDDTTTDGDKYVPDVKEDVIDRIEELEDALDEIKNKDPEATKADDQDDVDKIADELAKIIEGINDGSLVDPDYTEAEEAIKAADANDNIPAEDKAKIDELKEDLKEIQDDSTSNKKDDQDAVDEIAKEIQDIVDQYADCANGHSYGEATYTQAENPTDDNVGTYTQVCGECGHTVETVAGKADYAGLETAIDKLNAVDQTNLTDTAKNAIKLLVDEYNALDKNLPETVTIGDTTYSDGQKAIDDLTKKINDYLAVLEAGITDGSLVKPDFTGYDTDKKTYDELVAGLTVDGKTLIDGVADNVADLDKTVQEVKDDTTATKADDQKTVDDAEDDLEDIIAGINDGSLVKPDYTAAEENLANAKDLANNTEDLDDSVADKIKELEDALKKIENDPTSNEKDDQGAVDEIADDLKEIIDGINNGSLVKPDFDAYDTAKETYDELAAENDVLDSIKTEVAQLSDKIEDIRTADDSTKADDQETIDAATARLNEIIAGINDGSLVKPDYTDAEENLADAKDLITDDTTTDDDKYVPDVKEDVIDRIEELEDALEDIQKGYPDEDGNATEESTKADDQDDVDKIAGELAKIIEGINDGSLVDPDYTKAEEAIKAADANDNIPAEDKAKIEELKEDLKEIQNDPDSNKKDDQDAVDAIEEAVEEIIEKYAKCVNGHYWGETTTTTEVEATCSVAAQYKDEKTCANCGVTDVSYRAGEKDDTKHRDLTIEGYAATCTKAGKTDGYECLDCKRVIAQTTIPALGHTDDEGAVTKAPTCDATGTKTYYCTVCGEVSRTETIAANGHTWSEWTVKSEATCQAYEVQIRACSVCGKTETQSNEAGGYADHSYVTVEGKAPTCEGEGYKAYQKCKWCNLAIGYEAIKATGHSWSAWVVTTAKTCHSYEILGRSCPACSATQSKENKDGGYADHSMIPVEGMAPGCETEGYTDYSKCQWCDHAEGYETIPATGHVDGDGDGFCDHCGHDDGCVCHKGNLWSKIVRLIYSCISFLFRKKITCCDDMVWYFDGIDDIT